MHIRVFIAEFAGDHSSDRSLLLTDAPAKEQTRQPLNATRYLMRRFDHYPPPPTLLPYPLGKTRDLGGIGRRVGGRGVRVSLRFEKRYLADVYERSWLRRMLERNRRAFCVRGRVRGLVVLEWPAVYISLFPPFFSRALETLSTR